MKKDRPDDSTEVKIERESSRSAIERLYDTLEFSYISDGKKSFKATVTGGMQGIALLCGLKKTDGEPKYFIRDDKTKLKDGNLKEIIDSLDFQKLKPEVKTEFDTTTQKGGIKVTVGDDIYEVENSSEALRVANESSYEYANIQALITLAPLFAKLGEEGLIKPHEKLSVAGMSSRIDKHIGESEEWIKLIKEEIRKDEFGE